MSGRKAVSAADEAALEDVLRRRDRLLAEFAPYSLKAIAARFRISTQTVLRYSFRLLGRHRADPHVRNGRQ